MSLTVRERSPVAVGLISIVLIAMGMYLAFSINRFEGLRGVYTVSADLEDAAGLQAGNEVRVAGVKVGKVVEVALTPDAARVKMEVGDDVRLPVETRLEVKLKTLLGQKYIELRFPRPYLEAASGGADPSGATEGYLEPGDVIPMSQTEIPFEIHQAATQGTAVLQEIDKPALQRMLSVLAGTVDVSKQELRRALTEVSRATAVLDANEQGISDLLRNTRRVTGTLAQSDDELEGILSSSADVLGVLAERRSTTSSLLAATDALSADLGLLIQLVRGDVQVGAADLNLVLAAVEDELASVETAIAELGTAQEMFAQQLLFGRFVEGHICAITTEDTCVPSGSPEIPGIPVKGQQPPAGSSGDPQ
jgi:phospholipid/cholesterol/gamma-HCH transport system substrate-binding protein